MKKILLFVTLVSALMSNEGKEVFEKQCMSCHKPFVQMSELKENFLEFNNTKLQLKAPTLNQLSYRLKQRVGDRHGDEDLHRMEVTAFMSDYVLHPDKQKSVCLDEIMVHFDTMPSMKGKITDNELEAVGEYLYNYDTDIVKTKSVNYEGFDDALKEAKATQKIIMIEAVAKGCHFCIKMDREVLIEEEVVRALKKDFVSVKIDISTKALPLGLKVSVTPTFIFVDENSKVLMKMPGAWNKIDFLKILKEAKEKNKKDKK